MGPLGQKELSTQPVWIKSVRATNPGSNARRPGYICWTRGLFERARMEFCSGNVSKAMPSNFRRRRNCDQWPTTATRTTMGTRIAKRTTTYERDFSQCWSQLELDP